MAPGGDRTICPWLRFGCLFVGRASCDRLQVHAACCCLYAPSDSQLATPPPACQLLAVLRGALALGNPRLAEPALSCMHKLVAYAYMQGETGPSGRLDDEANLVTQVRCWEGRWHLVVAVARREAHVLRASSGEEGLNGQ